MKTFLDNAGRGSAGAVVAISLLFCAALSRAQSVDDDGYRERGQRIAMQTQAELGRNLKAALESGGTVAAMGYCKVRATPIAEEMSLRLGASIRRVSDRPRNPANAASAEELEYIDSFRRALAAGEQPHGAVRDTEQGVTGYYPIVTNGLCLQCHGMPGEDIEAQTRAAIDAAYPRDQATGYRENELRGLFVVAMPATAPAAD